MQTTFLKAGFLAAALGLAIGGNAFADEVKYSAELTGGAEVPPVETSATGTLDATYDTDSKMLSWTIDYSGLSGDPVAAHFHGPAAVGENAPPVVPVEVANIKKGSAELTDEQASELSSGMMYFNIHTQANPNGEIRGQVEAAN